MKFLSEKKALEKLHKLKSGHQKTISQTYETNAKSCLTCETQGACCLDAHFVNIHITKLEAAAIHKTVAKLPGAKQAEIYQRVDETIEKYDLTDSGDTFSQTFACPLFEKGTGCLVHAEGKPLPCIQHACYENMEDLPPDQLFMDQELLIHNLNIKTYGRKTEWLSLPLAIKKKRD